MTATRLMTVEDLEELGHEAAYRELVDGELRPPMSADHQHQHATTELLEALLPFVLAHELGKVRSTQAAFVVRRDPVRGDIVRIPDLSFTAAARLAQAAPPGQIPRTVPDLVVEVRSKGDPLPSVHAKIEEYLNVGVRLVWLIDPIHRRASVHRTGQEPATIPEGGALDGEDVLPGFTVPLAILFLPS